MIEADRVTERRAVHRGVDRPPWSPAQLVALLIGIGYIVLGAVALTRAGIDLDRIGPHVSVAGLHHTQVMGGIELLFGLLMLAAAAVPGAARGSMSFFGIVALGFGLIVVIQSSSFHRVLGVHEANGWLFVITGAVALLTAMVSPVFFGRSRVGRVGYARRAEVVDY